METVALRPGGLTWRILDGEAVVLDLADSSYFSVNRAGTALWTLLVKGATRAELVGVLVDAYGIEEGRAEADVDTFVAGLDARNLLER